MPKIKVTSDDQESRARITAKKQAIIATFYN